MEHHFNSPIDGPGKYDQAGFTMIEVLIAMGLFMIGILSLTGLQAACISGNASARIQTEATAIGSQVIEELRMLPEDHPDLDADGNPHELSRAGSQSYTVRWIVTDNVAVSETKSVRVTVLPDNRVNGKPVTMGTLLAR
jgi:type IV pilus assembly protein PilV